MGRGGGGGGHGGGGGGHHGGGGFHSSSSHRSSSSHSSGFSSGMSSRRSTVHHHYYYSYPRTRRTVYYGGTPGTGGTVGPAARGSGCLTVVIIIFILLFVSVALSNCSFAGHKAYVDEDVVAAQSEAYYNDNFKGKENVFLFYIAYSKNVDDEYQYIRYGSETNEIMDYNYDKFFEYYRDYFNDDVGIQLSRALAEFYNQRISGNYSKISTSNKFDTKMIFDELGWIDSRSMLQTTANSFYDYTGIQFAVAVVDYDKLPGANTDNTKIFVTFIVVAGVVVAVFIGYRWWKKKKEQKNKEAEDAIRILNTPLDQFNSINNLTQKYDSPTSGTTNTGSTAAPVSGAGSSDAMNQINNQISNYNEVDDDNSTF